MFFVIEASKEIDTANFPRTFKFIVEAQDGGDARTKVFDVCGVPALSISKVTEAAAVFKRHVVVNAHYYSDQQFFNLTMSSKTQPVAVNYTSNGRYRYQAVYRGVGKTKDGVCEARCCWGGYRVGIDGQNQLTVEEVRHVNSSHWHWLLGCDVPEDVADWKSWVVRYAFDAVKPRIEDKINQLHDFIRCFDNYVGEVC